MQILGLLSASYALGNLFGPLAGGILADWFGYEWGATIIGVVTFGYLVVYAMFGGLWNRIPENKVEPKDSTTEMPTIEIPTIETSA